MAANVSPGVFSKIIDLSQFVQAVPSTIGFISALTEKGEDNVLKFVGGRADFIAEYGEPNISTYGKQFGQGPYCAYNYLGESGSLYFMRCLPDNATYSNMRLDATVLPGDSTAGYQITFVEGMNSTDELETNLQQDGTAYPICFLYPIGRGQWYNKLGVRLTEVSNPTLWDQYILDIYERQSDGQDAIIESFEVSFEQFARDSAGESIWIVDVLNTYSAILRCEMWIDTDTDRLSAGYDENIKFYDKDIDTNVRVTLTPGAADITDIKQDFSDWEGGASGDYIAIAKDARGTEIWGWLGAAGGVDDEEIVVFSEVSLSTQSWNGNVADFDDSSDIEYRIKKSYGSVAAAFLEADPVPLRKGGDGDLLLADGSLDSAEATTLLNQAYNGIIDDNVLDSENVYFSMVFDCGYPSDVKTAISTLCQTRRDCVGILDNGDNTTVNLALATRNNVNTFNNYFIALYECYNKVFDSFTGQDVWFSPIYHMSYILPRNDTVAELWFAAAGFNRASIDTIKELRYNPRLGQRDQLYLKQLNPIVKFNPGYVVWGQLTSQAKASALQDLNIVRLVLYIKRAFEDFCRFFIFEQNDAITWSLVSGQLIAFLEVIKKKRGLASYSVEVSATDYERRTKRFHVNVTLDPTRTVEQIELNFFIV
ncbi:MAG: phage tail sheath C-terminal domain-containing protein [Candidatus Heimdallarchaeaceae archaeon]